MCRGLHTLHTLYAYSAFLRLYTGKHGQVYIICLRVGEWVVPVRVCSADLLFSVLTHAYSGRQLDLSCFIFTLSGRIHSMDKRSCLILQRAREAASLVLNLCITNTRDRDFLSHFEFSFNNSTPSLRSFFCSSFSFITWAGCRPHL